MIDGKYWAPVLFVLPLIISISHDFLKKYLQQPIEVCASRSISWQGVGSAIPILG